MVLGVLEWKAPELLCILTHLKYTMKSLAVGLLLSSATSAPAFDGSCLCPVTAPKWVGTATLVGESNLAASCDATVRTYSQQMGGPADESCDALRTRYVDITRSNHPEEEIAEGFATIESKCCTVEHPVATGGVSTGAIVGGVLGGCALVGIGLAVRKKKAQRSDYAEMPK